ncbi:MAG: acyl-CoA/acyl-ACP dehydrogenase [Chloroflexi bacterium]|nr:acyl-CoA/acyl-ACP dehydrogenase [Chloroflexota bacterium]
MDFALTAEQELLRKEVRRFLETECPKKLVKELEAGERGYSPEIWKKMADLGWLGLVLPEEYGGVGGSLLDLAVFFEEIGRAVFPSPLFSTLVLGVLPIMEAGSQEQKTQILPKVGSGELILTLALTEPEADYRPDFMSTKAARTKRGFAINGTKLFIQNAHIADCMLVVARTGRASSDGNGVTVFLVKKGTTGIGLNPLVTAVGDKQFEVIFDRVPVSAADVLGGIGTGWPLVESTLRKATAIQCVMTVGVMQQALSMTAGYTSTRVQFGRPIGSFQAVQHRLADMLTDVEGARWTSYQAVSRLSKGLPAAREVAIAKAWTSDACQRVAYAAQHLHGGIGMDLDYDLHFYFRWAKALELNLGVAPYHRLSIEPVIKED